MLASTVGDTARLAVERFSGSEIKLVVVPHQYGFRQGAQRFPPELVAELERRGHSVCFSTMLSHTDELYGTHAPQAMATLLRTLCQGMKVCVEILLMATEQTCRQSGLDAGTAIDAGAMNHHRVA